MAIIPSLLLQVESRSSICSVVAEIVILNPISGRWSDVQTAAAEIREAAHHFTQLRAERSRIGALQSPLAPSEGEPGTITVKVSN